MRSLPICAALVFASACHGSKDIRPTSDRTDEVPVEVLEGLFDTMGADFVIETPVKRPPVPHELSCDWSSSPPQVRFVDPSTPKEKQIRRRAEYDPSVIGSAWNVGREIPTVHLPYDVELDFGHASRVFEWQDGQLHEVPLSALSYRGHSWFWVARLCERADEIAIEVDWSWQGSIVVLRRIGTRWIVVARAATWMT